MQTRKIGIFGHILISLLLLGMILAWVWAYFLEGLSASCSLPCFFVVPFLGAFLSAAPWAMTGRAPSRRGIFFVALPATMLLAIPFLLFVAFGYREAASSFVPALIMLPLLMIAYAPLWAGLRLARAPASLVSRHSGPHEQKLPAGQ